MTIERGRRHLLRIAGATLAVTAGCLSDDGTEDGSPADGAQPANGSGDSNGDGNGDEPGTEDESGSSDGNESATDDESASDDASDDPVVGTVTTDGVEVPLVSVDDAVAWHRDDGAVFVDSRGESQFERARIAGAVWSPAPGGRTDDPLENVERDTRIVTYCGCPHHLSSMRAASLIDDGYETVYALDEGIHEWADRGYPLEGSDVEQEVSLRVVRGRADPDAAGEMVIAEHEPSGQLEAAPVGDDGEYELHLRFADLPPDATLTLEAPGYEVTAPLSALEDGVVGRDGTVR